MPKSPVTLTLDTARLNRALAAFGRAQGPEAVDRAVRRISFGVAGRIVRSLNGTEGNPKRVDTGRYRAAWAAGGSEATGMMVPAPTSPESQPGDGSGVMTGRGLAAEIVVTNNVEYGPYVEYGTAHMAAGLHAQDALRKEGAKAAEVIGGEFRRAWEG